MRNEIAEYSVSMDPRMGKDLKDIRLLSQDVAESIIPIVYPQGMKINFKKKRELIGIRKEGETEGLLKSINIKVKRKLGWGRNKTQEVIVAGRTPEGYYRMRMVMEPENRRVLRVGEVQKYNDLAEAYLPTEISEARQWLEVLTENSEKRFLNKLNSMQ